MWTLQTKTATDEYINTAEVIYSGKRTKKLRIQCSNYTARTPIGQDSPSSTNYEQ